MQNEKAMAAFMVAKFNIDAMLKRLQALSNDHFDVHPDKVNWADVGTLKYCENMLRQITDFAFMEGENAE